MQNGALIHTSKASMDSLSERDFEVSDWPSRSLDLNRMEYVREILTRKVYADGRQFKTIISLRESFSSVRAELGEENIPALANSML